MAKVKPYEIDKKEKERVIGKMFEVIERLNTKKEIVDFLLGIFTASEALMMARRIQVAKMILEGDSYTEIRRKIGVSSHTIQGVERWLYGGDEKNIKWLRKCILNKAEKQRDIRSKNLSGNSLDKYAHHRFIKELFGL